MLRGSGLVDLLRFVILRFVECVMGIKTTQLIVTLMRVSASEMFRCST